MKKHPLIKLPLLLLSACILFSCGPTEEEIKRQKEQQEKIKEQQARQQRIEEARQDTIASYIVKAEGVAEKKRFSNAIQYMDSALTFANVGEESFNLLQRRAYYYFKKRKYKDAIEDYTVILAAHYDAKNNYYNRAKCYQKLKKYQEAVDDLRFAMQLNHAEASSLYEKINPERKRVAYYVTRCCDGTTSNAKGRGACSHHGGVCNWNDPVYETYRKY